MARDATGARFFRHSVSDLHAAFVVYAPSYIVPVSISCEPATCSDDRSMGSRRHGQGGSIYLLEMLKSVLCISSYSQTLSRPIIYALFSQFFVSTPFFCWAGEIWRAGVVHLVVLAYVWGRRLKEKVVSFFRKKCTPEKIVAVRMNFSTPGKNPAGIHGSIIE